MLTKNIKLIHLYRYSRDYGMFRFCIADSEHDWREGTEHDKFIEKCLASVDRQKQPWLIFIAHRVLGYTSSYWQHAHLGKPMGRESFQKLWQKYKLHMAFYGRVHNYGRTCPVYEVYSLTKLTFIAAPMCELRDNSLCRHFLWNNAHCCWWGREPHIELWPFESKQESLPRSRLWIC